MKNHQGEKTKRSNIVFRLILFFLISIAMISGSYAENGNIKGKIIDKTTKQPLIGAIVTVLDQKYGASTDEQGIYIIKDVPENIYKIQIALIGYSNRIETDVRVVRGKTTYVRELELEESPVTTGEMTINVDPLQEWKDMPVSSYNYSKEEIRRSPGAAGDVFRAVDAMPGVSSSGGEFSSFYVRGSSPKDNLILIDNIPFDKVTHFAEQGGADAKEGGRFSIFSNGIVEDAEFQAGGFGACYGGKHSSLLNMKLKEGNRESPTINGTYDFLGWEVNYDGPSYIDRHTSVLLSMRNQDFENILKMIGQSSEGYPKYSDYLLKTTTDISPNHKLTVLGIYSTEEMIRTKENVFDYKKQEDLFNNEIMHQQEDKGLLGLTWRFLTGKSSVLQTSLFYANTNTKEQSGKVYTDSINGVFPTEEEAQYNDNISMYKNIETQIGLRSLFTNEFSNSLTLTAGIELQKNSDNFRYQLNQRDTVYVFNQTEYRPNNSIYYLIQDPSDVNSTYNDGKISYAGFTEVSYSPIATLTLNPGVRVEYNGFNRKVYAAPRLSGKYYLSSETSLNFATGIYYQTPELFDVISDIRNRNLKDEKSIHYIAGLTHYLTTDLKLNVEGYYKSFSDVVTQSNHVNGYLTNDGTGSAYGIDIGLVKRFVSNLYGQVSYSYSQSKRDDHDGRGSYDYDFSQPNIFSFLIGYQMNDEWSFSAKWKYATGGRSIPTSFMKMF